MEEEEVKIPLQITSRSFSSSEALNQLVEEELEGLAKFFDRIQSCHVTVEQPHRHQRQGNHFKVRVELVVPGTELVVNRSPDEHESHENPYATVVEAFGSMKRMLQDYARKQRGEVKRLAARPIP
jgi:ribosomal subunit interface protein